MFLPPILYFWNTYLPISSLSHYNLSCALMPIYHFVQEAFFLSLTLLVLFGVSYFILSFWRLGSQSSVQAILSSVSHN